MKNPIRLMVCAKQMTREMAVEFPPEKGLSLLNQREQLEPALQMVTLKILIERQTEEMQDTN